MERIHKFFASKLVIIIFYLSIFTCCNFKDKKIIANIEDITYYAQKSFALCEWNEGIRLSVNLQNLTDTNIVICPLTPCPIETTCSNGRAQAKIELHDNVRNWKLVDGLMEMVITNFMYDTVLKPNSSILIIFQTASILESNSFKRIRNLYNLKGNPKNRLNLYLNKQTKISIPFHNEIEEKYSLRDTLVNLNSYYFTSYEILPEPVE